MFAFLSYEVYCRCRKCNTERVREVTKPDQPSMLWLSALPTVKSLEVLR